jgi:hypothetical protein
LVVVVRLVVEVAPVVSVALPVEHLAVVAHLAVVVHLAVVAAPVVSLGLASQGRTVVRSVSSSDEERSEPRASSSVE